MKFILAALIALVSVAAIQEVSVHQGEIIAFQTELTGVDKLLDTTAMYTVDGTNFVYSVTNWDSPTSVITTPLTFYISPGEYTLNIAIRSNGQLLREDRVRLNILPPQAPPAPVAAQQPAKTPTTQPIPVKYVTSSITIPPIPDVNAGETIVVPVTIKGNGNMPVKIPTLDYATYEAPSSVSVSGERTFMVVVHVDKNAQPGLHLLTVSAAGEQATARIRIISYKERSWLPLLIAGIVLIIVGLVLLFTQTRRPKTAKPKEDAELITYY